MFPTKILLATDGSEDAAYLAALGGADAVVFAGGVGGAWVWPAGRSSLRSATCPS